MSASADSSHPDSSVPGSLPSTAVPSASAAVWAGAADSSAILAPSLSAPGSGSQAAPYAPRFSRRVDVSQPNPIALAQQAAQVAGRSLYQLNDSNPTHHGLSSAELVAAGLPPVYQAEPRGQRSARLTLAAFLSQRTVIGSDSAQSVDPDRLYLTSSTSQAYSWLMKLLCDPGDAVLCPTPGYPLIDSIARLEGVRALTYPLRYDGSWTVDLAAVERLVQVEGSRLKALILINPNNPTGSYLGAADYERLVALCRQQGLALIADEVFFDFPLRPLGSPRRVAGEERVLTFGLDGFSKLLAAPHAKVGWIQVSGPAAALAQAQPRLDLIADDFLPMSSLIADQIPAFLEQVPAQLSRLRERTAANLTVLDQLLAASPTGVVSLLRPEGGWNVLLRFPSVIEENELVTRLIADYGLTGQPGYFFDMSAPGYLAVSLLPEPDQFKRGIETLLACIDSYLTD